MRFRGYRLTIRGQYVGPVWDFLGRIPDEIRPGNIQTWFYETESDRDAAKQEAEKVLMSDCKWKTVQVEIG